PKHVAGVAALVETAGLAYAILVDWPPFRMAIEIQTVLSLGIAIVGTASCPVTALMWKLPSADHISELIIRSTRRITHHCVDGDRCFASIIGLPRTIRCGCVVRDDVPLQVKVGCSGIGDRSIGTGWNRAVNPCQQEDIAHGSVAYFIRKRPTVVT